MQCTPPHSNLPQSAVDDPLAGLRRLLATASALLPLSLVQLSLVLAGRQLDHQATPLAVDDDDALVGDRGLEARLDDAETDRVVLDDCLVDDAATRQNEAQLVGRGPARGVITPVLLEQEPADVVRRPLDLERDPCGTLARNIEVRLAGGALTAGVDGSHGLLGHENSFR